MRTVSWICAFLLLIGILPLGSWFSWLPDWYVQLWKAFVCAGAIWLAWKDFRYKSLATWNLALVMIAVYYNPIFPIHMQNSYVEAAISILCMLFLIAFGYKRNVTN
ncbi:MAG: hypothetical protein RR202_02120 [Bacteroidales bacterium]